MNKVTSEEFFLTLKKSEFGQKYLEIINSAWRLPKTYRKTIKLEDKRVGYEIHHIQPLSLGGDQKGDNRVYLKVFDHILSHYYLALAYPCPETLHAFWAMTGIKLKRLEEPLQVDLQRLEHYAELRSQAIQEKGKIQQGRIDSSESHKKSWETRRKNGTDRGWKHTEEAIRKNIESKRNNGTLGRNNMSLAWETRRKNGTDHVSEEAKQKRLNTLKTSEAWKNCHNPEVVSKIQATKKRNGTVKHSEETRKKISEANRGRHRVYDSEGHYILVK